MARMLQALKNLEARTPRANAGTAPKPKERPVAETLAVASEPAIATSGGVQLAVTPFIRPATAAGSPTTASSIDSLHTLVSGLASLESGIPDPYLPGVQLAQSITVVPDTTLPEAPLPAVSSVSTIGPNSVPSPEVTDIERKVARILADPVRSKPLRQLVERFRRDMEQTAARTVALVGVNEQSAAHEAILYVGTLLAQQQRGKILILDSDLSRRSLSEALEYGRDAGLAELFRNTAVALPNCRSTATPNLLFLPSGQLPPGEVSLPASRLGQVFGELTQSFDSLLIDGGRASDSSAATLARMADATYLVVQLGTVEANEAQSALAALRAAGARVLGCIAV